jgi:hypothetical protein
LLLRFAGSLCYNLSSMHTTNALIVAEPQAAPRMEHTVHNV